MNKADIVARMHAKTNHSSKAEIAKQAEAFIEVLKEGLENGESITITGFGSFRVIDRAERKGRNPRTGEEISIPASQTIKFTPGKALKEVIR